jgi:hypothetical protein
MIALDENLITSRKRIFFPLNMFVGEEVPEHIFGRLPTVFSRFYSIITQQSLF